MTSHPGGTVQTDPPRDSTRHTAQTKVPEDDGDDRKGRSNVRRTDAPIGREWRSYCLRRY
jgi:hypothetical protein